MPVPKQKKSRTRRNTRRAHQSLGAPTIVVCPNCKAVMVPHRVCSSCGHYKGREAIRTEI